MSRLVIFALLLLSAASAMAATAVDEPHQAPAGWRLVWSDEFDAPDGAGVDPAKWGFDIGGGGWGNGELQYYTDRTENVRHERGCLVIEARREDYEVYWEYTSGRILTKGRFEQAYGRFEARIKVPTGQGIWPAFWLLGKDIDAVGWPACGEIDIMEHIGKEPGTVHGTIHGPGFSGSFGLGAAYTLDAGRMADEFHVFAIEWEPQTIRWYFDGRLYQTRSAAEMVNNMRWVFDHPSFIILNVAVGGYWPGKPDATTVFPVRMEVDYVRVYERIEGSL